MAASRGKVLTLYAHRLVHFVWAPLMLSAVYSEFGLIVLDQITEWH